MLRVWVGIGEKRLNLVVGKRLRMVVLRVLKSGEERRVRRGVESGMKICG